MVIKSVAVTDKKTWKSHVGTEYDRVQGTMESGEKFNVLAIHPSHWKVGDVAYVKEQSAGKITKMAKSSYEESHLQKAPGFAASYAKDLIVAGIGEKDKDGKTLSFNDRFAYIFNVVFGHIVEGHNVIDKLEKK